jgi:hypothetical protein
MSRHEIYTADECFLTGTAAEVIAAVKLDHRIIGTGKPGPITQRVIARFRELTQTTARRFTLRISTWQMTRGLVRVRVAALYDIPSVTLLMPSPTCPSSLP